MNAGLKYRIFNIKNQKDFLEVSLEVFKYQIAGNLVYQKYVNELGIDPDSVNSAEMIPFLPIEFFRNQRVITGDKKVEIIFVSSGTAGVIPGKHYVTDLRLYEESFLRSFRINYGDPEGYLICALLPSYTDREGSSLVYMADNLIKRSSHPDSGFYKNNIDDLLKVIDEARGLNKKILLLGVSFALVDLAEIYSPDLSGVIVMETGGMKGRRKEITRQELHSFLKEEFNVHSIHSEYGMTELMSQAYSKGDGLFYSPPWMKVMIRDPHDPLFCYVETGKAGGINIIDLANINSCSFIATGDLGRVHQDYGFEVLGRFDSSDIRGCNLLME